MNEKSAKILVSGVAVVFAGSVLAHAALTISTPETKSVSVPVPGPTVTEVQVTSSPTPVPGPTVTKKVRVPGPKVTVRVTVTAASRDYKRKKVTSLPRGSVQNQAKAVFGSQYSCAASIIQRESGWSVHARNPSSGAYGLGQALPPSKMAAYGSDWQNNASTQLVWMKAYLDERYGGACAGWEFWRSHNYY